MSNMLNVDFSNYAETWTQIIDDDDNVWQGWVQYVEYPDETENGQWSLGFEHMLLNGKRTSVEVLDQEDIKSIQVMFKDYDAGYRNYQQHTVKPQNK